jgi:hypothetical protein
MQCLPACPAPASVNHPNFFSRFHYAKQVFVDGEWGTVCDDDWDVSDAAVACRQLGFSADGAQALSSSPTSGLPRAYFSGNDSIRINMDDVGCIGTEAALHDCAFVTWQNETCDHSEDAGVRCSGFFF